MSEVIDKFPYGVTALERGKVWCTVCGRMQRVRWMSCLVRGWPRCCGYTMTIDSPEERAPQDTKPVAPEKVS